MLRSFAAAKVQYGKIAARMAHMQQVLGIADSLLGARFEPPAWTRPAQQNAAEMLQRLLRHTMIVSAGLDCAHRRLLIAAAARKKGSASRAPARSSLSTRENVKQSEAIRVALRQGNGPLLR
jgi:hypothetical protein